MPPPLPTSLSCRRQGSVPLQKPPGATILTLLPLPPCYQPPHPRLEDAECTVASGGGSGPLSSSSLKTRTLGLHLGNKGLSSTSLDPQINSPKAPAPNLTQHPQYPNWFRSCTKSSLSRALGLEPEGPTALDAGQQWPPREVTRIHTGLSRKGTLPTMEQLLISGGRAESMAQGPGRF